MSGAASSNLLRALNKTFLGFQINISSAPCTFHSGTISDRIRLRRGDPPKPESQRNFKKYRRHRAQFIETRKANKRATHKSQCRATASRWRPTWMWCSKKPHEVRGGAWEAGITVLFVFQISPPLNLVADWSINCQYRFTWTNKMERNIEAARPAFEFT